MDKEKQMQVKKIIREDLGENDVEEYQFFDEEVMQDTDGNNVTILKPVGIYNVGALTSEKQEHQSVIDLIQTKLDLIAGLVE